MEILRELRSGNIDVLVGINLLREGLDLPEVSLVAIFDADREGFLRSANALIQTIGRAARNINGTVILYADRVTKAMQIAIDETQRRRAIQTIYNHENNIVPKTIIKTVIDVLEIDAFLKNQEPNPNLELDLTKIQSIKDFNNQIKKLEKQMQNLAKNLEFEKAAAIRDQIMLLKKNIIRI